MFESTVRGRQILAKSERGSGKCGHDIFSWCEHCITPEVTERGDQRDLTSSGLCFVGSCYVICLLELSLLCFEDLRLSFHTSVGTVSHVCLSCLQETFLFTNTRTCLRPDCLFHSFVSHRTNFVCDTAILFSVIFKLVKLFC